MRRILISLFVALVAISGAPLPRAGAITHGEPVDQDGARFVTKINIAGDQPRSCSGALIASLWVITSASCLASGEDRIVRPGPPANPTTVTIDRPDLNKDHGQSLTADRVVPHPDLDVALVRLSLRALNVPPVAIASNAPATGDVVSMHGYGRTENRWVPDQIQVGTAAISEVSHSSLELETADDAPSVACRGDAGGPVTRATTDGPLLVAVLAGSAQGGCLADQDEEHGTTAVRVDALADWIEQNTPDLTSEFGAVHDPGDGKGIGGFDLRSPADQVIAYDYEGSGKSDDLVLYRPGSKILWILQHRADGSYARVFWTDNGFVDFDLAQRRDRVVAFDCHRTGNQDCLLLYRPGLDSNDPTSASMTVLDHDDDTFNTVFAAQWPVHLGNPADQIIPMDYDHTGRMDHIVLYRPGHGWVSILPFDGEKFLTSVYATHGAGIGGFDLGSAADRLVAFDNDHAGGLSHLVAYRPGEGTARVVGRTEAPHADDPDPVHRPDTDTSLVESFSYPDAERIRDELGIELISGDGHIVLEEDCSVPPDEEGVGVMKVLSTVDSGGRKTACFRVLGASGRIDLLIPNVYSIRGDGYSRNAGHDFVARVDTESDPPVEIEGESDSYNPVGIGADPESEPTTLLQIRIPS